jgi:hypothetical protein
VYHHHHLIDIIIIQLETLDSLQEMGAFYLKGIIIIIIIITLTISSSPV